MKMPKNEKEFENEMFTSIDMLKETSKIIMQWSNFANCRNRLDDKAESYSEDTNTPYANRKAARDPRLHAWQRSQQIGRTCDIVIVRFKITNYQGNYQSHCARFAASENHEQFGSLRRH